MLVFMTTLASAPRAVDPATAGMNIPQSRQQQCNLAGRDMAALDGRAQLGKMIRSTLHLIPTDVSRCNFHVVTS
jgi:hypothetical protein